MKKRKPETFKPKPVPVAPGWESIGTATVADVAAAAAILEAGSGRKMLSAPKE